jgi:hypothetical protein
MKDYIIWLKSGECVSGTAKEEDIMKLQEEFSTDGEGKVFFKDEDGIIVIDFSRVEAIAINKRNECNKMGF